MFVAVIVDVKAVPTVPAMARVLVMTGVGGLTVRLTALLAIDPAVLPTTTAYNPVSEVCTLVRVRLASVAPLSTAPFLSH